MRQDIKCACSVVPVVQEEQQKRRERAGRFNLPAAEAPEQDYRPDEEVAAKTKRAQKFGVVYEPSSAVLMDMGEPQLAIH